MNWLTLVMNSECYFDSTLSDESELGNTVALMQVASWIWDRVKCSFRNA